MSLTNLKRKNWNKIYGMVTDEDEKQKYQTYLQGAQRLCEENAEIINRTAMNTSHTSLIDDCTNLNGGHMSDRKHKLEVPEMENT